MTEMGALSVVAVRSGVYNMPDIFISFSMQDKPFADFLHNHLVENRWLSKESPLRKFSEFVR